MKKIVCILDMHTDFAKKKLEESIARETTNITSMKEIAGWC